MSLHEYRVDHKQSNVRKKKKHIGFRNRNLFMHVLGLEYSTTSINSTETGVSLLRFSFPWPTFSLSSIF